MIKGLWSLVPISSMLSLCTRLCFRAFPFICVLHLILQGIAGGAPVTISYYLSYNTHAHYSPKITSHGGSFRIPL